MTPGVPPAGLRENPLFEIFRLIAEGPERGVPVTGPDLAAGDD